MRTSKLNLFAAAICVFTTAVSGCGGPPSGGAMRPMAYAQAGRRLLMPFVPQPGHRDHGRSWMARGASAIKKLLYISDIDSYDVFVYNYETGESVGKLTGFNYPQGQCVDKKGDVWITNFGNGSQPVSVVEYAHGGTTPIATVIPDGYPIGCSIDPRTGDLAVANRFLSTGQLYGDVQVWKTPSNPPTDYVNSGYCQLLQSPGYDDAGNLFVLGYVDAVGDTLCVLPAHGKALEGSVILNGQIYDAEGVMWDGKYITLSDSNPYDRTNSGVTAIYRAVPKKGVDNVLSLLIVGSTILTDTCFHGQDDTVVQQAFIVGNKNTPANDEEGKVVIGGNIVCYSRFDFWKYPQGGNPSSSLAQPPIRPQGQSVSIAE